MKLHPLVKYRVTFLTFSLLRTRKRYDRLTPDFLRYKNNIENNISHYGKDNVTFNFFQVDFNSILIKIYFSDTHTHTENIIEY